MAALALTAETPEVQENAKAIFEAQRLAIYIRTDKLFAGLMAVQWAGAVVAACCLSPLTWAGTVSQVHPHVWAAIFLGGLLSIFPICLALIYPGRMTTRQVIAVSQLLMSALLIHVTGGRTETHFHIFGSLAFLAFYRDWRVLASATLVTATDHLLRGMYWPQSVYGLAVASPWLTVEHAGWVVFEDVFLLISCRQSLREMSQISLRQSQLQSAERVLIHSNETLETQVEQRTQELSEALQEHRNVMETVPDILFRLDMSGRLVQWNRKMETVTGLTPEELQGKSALDLFAEDEKCVIAQAIAQAFCSGYTAVEGSLLGTNGVAALHQFSGVPLQNAAGELIGLTGMGRDITERRHSEIALLESETRYRGLVDHSPEAIIVYSENRFVYANAAAVTLFAASCAEELIGRLIFDFVHADNRSLAHLRAARSQQEGEISPLTEQKYVRLDGEVINVEAVSTGIIYQGKPAGQVLIRDITKRKKAEEEILALNAEMICAYDATIEGWSRALDLRDHETEGHSRRVTEMTLRLAEAAGVPSEELIHVRRGALLHDIGKMGVPDAILLKPGPLDDAEWEIMRRHPELARSMLAPTEFLHPALDIPYCHHEKWDGSGYPCGLHGEEIPLPARLFALVDVWDALTSDRPYRAAWPRGRVLDHLRSLAGTHFDPAIVSIFLRMIEADALPEVFIMPPAPRLAA